MARLHYYKWLTNQQGQPISGADIYVYLANTTTLVPTYSSEVGSTVTTTGPQTVTNSLGYFEFWVGDSNDTNGYPRTQKFKIKWTRAGVENSYIDNVSLFDTDIEEVDETDTGESGDSMHKNKLISNHLANKWNSNLTLESGIFSANYDITDTDGMDTLFLDGSINITLPDSAIKRKIQFAKYDDATDSIISPKSVSESIYGLSTVTLSRQYDTLVLESDGISTWYLFYKTPELVW